MHGLRASWPLAHHSVGTSHALKMKRVIILFCSILLLAKILHAWLHEAPYRAENGFLVYGGFHPSFYHSLTATQIAISLSEDKLDCGFACMAEPKCASFNIAVNPDSNGLFLCELLYTVMFHDKEKLRSNASHHHYSPVSQNFLVPFFFMATYLQKNISKFAVEHWLLILFL